MSNSRLEGTRSTSDTSTNAGMTMDAQVTAIRRQWATDPRWSGIERSYSAADVVRLRGSVQEEHTPGPARRRAPVVRCCTPAATSTRSAR